jgi:hypothetical protein
MRSFMDFCMYQMNVTVNSKATEWKDMEWVHLTENKTVEKGRVYVRLKFQLDVHGFMCILYSSIFCSTCFG